MLVRAPQLSLSLIYEATGACTIFADLSISPQLRIHAVLPNFNASVTDEGDLPAIQT